MTSPRPGAGGRTRARLAAVVPFDPAARELARRLAHAEDALALTPRSSEARLDVARVLAERVAWARGRHDAARAVDDAERLCRLFPRQPMPRVVLAEAHAIRGELGAGAATSATVAALRRGLDDREGLVRLSRALLDVGLGREAVVLLDQVLEALPDDGEAWWLRSKTHEGDEFAELLEQHDLARAVSCTPDAPRPLARHAELLARGWATKLRALRDVERAATLAPDDPEVLRARSYVYATQGREDEARADLARVLELLPGDFDAHRRLANLFFRNDDAEAGFAELRRAVDAAPDEAERWDHLAHRLAWRDRAEDALRVVEEALARLPGDGLLLYRRAHVLRGLGRPDEELAAWGRTLRARPGDPWVLCRRAEAKEARGDLRGARADYAAALEASPNDHEILLARAAVSRKQGRLAAAHADLRRAVRAAPDREECWIARGHLRLLLFRQGNAAARRGAFADFDRACRLWPTSAGFAGRAAAREAGRAPSYEASREDLDRAIREDPNDPDWWWQRALLHERHGAPDRCAADIAEAARLGHPEARARLAAHGARAGARRRRRPRAGGARGSTRCDDHPQ